MKKLALTAGYNSRN